MLTHKDLSNQIKNTIILTYIIVQRANVGSPFYGVTTCKSGQSREYGVSGPLIQAICSMYDLGQNLVGFAGSQPGSCLFHSSHGVDGAWFQLLLYWFTAECDVAQMRISTSKSEAMVLKRK